tara:strand:+ start:600 stop:791 length:192 start_codon:yes stop_codon:yes gene_type:complete
LIAAPLFEEKLLEKSTFSTSMVDPELKIPPPLLELPLSIMKFSTLVVPAHTQLCLFVVRRLAD